MDPSANPSSIPVSADINASRLLYSTQPLPAKISILFTYDTNMITTYFRAHHTLFGRVTIDERSGFDPLCENVGVHNATAMAVGPRHMTNTERKKTKSK